MWKTIPGFERYDVHVDGRVRRNVDMGGHHGRLYKAGGELTSFVHKAVRRKPRLMLGLIADEGGQVRKQLAWWILLAHVGPPPTDTHQASHHNDDAMDNRLENLAWKTPAENARDRITNGKLPKKYKKITKELAVEIRRLKSEEGLPATQISDLLNASYTNVLAVLSGRTWRKVNVE